MSTDKTAALEQWNIAHREASSLIHSLENAPYTNRLVWNACIKMLAMLDGWMRRLLA